MLCTIHLLCHIPLDITQNDMYIWACTQYQEAQSYVAQVLFLYFPGFSDMYAFRVLVLLKVHKCLSAEMFQPDT